MRLPFFNGTGQRPSRSSPFVVYTMASDAMLAYAAVFFESFRRYNPTLPLWVIPYDTCDKDRAAGQALRRAYGEARFP